MKCVILILAVLIGLASCTPPLGPKASGICLVSPNSRVNADEIRVFLLEEANRRQLFVTDWSDEFRELEHNKSLVFMRFRSGRFRSEYEVAFHINPTHGASQLANYGYDSRMPEDVQPIVELLQAKFGFSLRSENKYGGCP